MKPLALLLGQWTILFAALTALGADDVNQVFEKLYGERARQLKPKDVCDFAQKLAQDATDLEGDEALRQLLLTKATGYYYKCPPGEDKASLGDALITGWMRLAQKQVDANKPSEALPMLQQASMLATTNKSAKVSQVIVGKIRAVKCRIEVANRLEDLLARWKARPNDPVVARQLAMLYVLDLDKPAEAAPYLPASAEESWRTYVPLASRDANSLQEQAMTEIAQWYEALADKASLGAQAVAHQRAGEYYRCFLAKHGQKDLSYLSARAALDKVQKELEKLSALGVCSTWGAESVQVDLSDGVAMDVILVPAGRFLMGSPNAEKGHKSDESPQHDVAISSPFYMSATKVTQAQYKAVLGINPSLFKDPNCPVDNVSWNDAMDFCKALSERLHKLVRLPTEAQWEYACRAGTGTRFSCGDSENALTDCAWYGEPNDALHPVAVKKPNPWGFFDMHGSLLEWCGDFYGGKYYSASDKADPQGPVGGDKRVQRGGNSRGGADNCRAASRYCSAANARSYAFGFRIVVVE